MTSEAKNVMAEILLTAQERLIRNKKPFMILSRIINDYFREWGLEGPS